MGMTLLELHAAVAGLLGNDGSQTWSIDVRVHSANWYDGKARWTIYSKFHRQWEGSSPEDVLGQMKASLASSDGQTVEQASKAVDETAGPFGCPVCGETALDLTGKLVCHPDQYVSRFAACNNCNRTVPLDELVTVQSSMYETKQCAKCRS